MISQLESPAVRLKTGGSKTSAEMAGAALSPYFSGMRHGLEALAPVWLPGSSFDLGHGILCLLT